MSQLEIWTKKDRGSVYIKIENENEHYNLHVWTDYKEVKVFVNDKSGDSKSRQITYKWFQENLKGRFPIND